MAEGEKEKGHAFKSRIVMGILLLSILVVLANIYFLTNIQDELNKAISGAKEQTKPANLQVIEITDNSCTDCFDINQVLDSINSTNVTITSLRTLEFSSSEAKQLISQLNIRRIPTLIVSGEITKSGEFGTGWIPVDESVVFNVTYPPYVDTSTGAVKGRINVTLVFDPSCSDCTDLTTTIAQLKQAGVSIVGESKVDYSSDQGKSLISEYGLSAVPTLIFSKEFGAYENIVKNWNQLGTIGPDGSYVLKLLNPPYRNLTTNKIDGLVSVIYLTDNSCTICYDVKEHKQILISNFDVKVINETSIDISSSDGKSLISKYNITKVPTILFSPEASAYSSLVKVWGTASTGSTIPVGSIESDGWFVFRDVALMGNYTDLTTGKIVTS